MIKGLFIFGTGLSVGLFVGVSKSEKTAENLGKLSDALGDLAEAVGNGPFQVEIQVHKIDDAEPVAEEEASTS